MVPVPVRYSSEIARSYRSSRRPRLGRAWPESPPRRPPPSSARHRPWRTRRRDCAAGGDPPKLHAPSDLFCTVRIRYANSLCNRSTTDSWAWSMASAHRAHTPCGAPRQPAATMCRMSQQPRSTRGQSRLFYKIAPRFLVNQPAVRFSSK